MLQVFGKVLTGLREVLGETLCGSHCLTFLDDPAFIY